MSHCCRWNVTQSCCSPRQDMTRLPKPGRSPSIAASERGRVKPPGDLSPPLPTGISAHRCGAELRLGGRMGSHLFLFLFIYIFHFFFFFPQPGKPSPPTLAHPPMGRCGAVGTSPGFCCPIFQARPYEGAGRAPGCPAPGTAPAPVPMPQFPHPVGSGDFPIGERDGGYFRLCFEIGDQQLQGVIININNRAQSGLWWRGGDTREAALSHGAGAGAGPALR